MLRIEFEQSLAANEQTGLSVLFNQKRVRKNCGTVSSDLFGWTFDSDLLYVPGPINREMRNLITSLKNHNEQLKGEVARYKRKLKEAQAEITKVCFEEFEKSVGVVVVAFLLQHSLVVGL